MSKVVKGFLCGLVLIAVVVAPACTHKTKPNTMPTTTTAATESVAPQVAVVTNTAPTEVPAPKDFVQTETAVTTENLSGNIDEANRQAQERGYIKDAFYNFDDATLSADAQSALSDSATWLKKHSEYNLLIEGHCDERGTEQYNLALGDRRAQSAKTYLSTLGVDAGRMRTVSYGEERPFEAGHSEESWAKNRRAHLVLVGR